MPTAAPDDLYWNPMDLDSDESMPYPSKQYIDPWDLENYAYIRKHLDSVDLSSDPSSLGEAMETSAFYYIPAKPLPMKDEESIYYQRTSSQQPPPSQALEKIYDTSIVDHGSIVSNRYHQDAEYYYTMQRAPRMMAATGRYDTINRQQRGNGGNYSGVDEVTRRSTRRHSHAGAGSIYGTGGAGAPLSLQMPAQYGTYTKRSHRMGQLPQHVPQTRRTMAEDVYDVYDYEPTDMDLYGIPENSTMQIYEKNKTLRRYQGNKNDGPVAKMAKSRSHSFSVGDYEYDPYKLHQPIYTEDPYVRSDFYDSTGSSPIYDDVRGTMLAHQRPKPRHFKLSNYGHLKIDYSFSWNNLNKYIYN